MEPKDLRWWEVKQMGGDRKSLLEDFYMQSSREGASDLRGRWPLSDVRPCFSALWFFLNSSEQHLYETISDQLLFELAWVGGQQGLCGEPA